MLREGIRNDTDESRGSTPGVQNADKETDLCLVKRGMLKLLMIASGAKLLS